MLSIPFQRYYVLHSPEVVRAIEHRSYKNAITSNLVDFGIDFTGLSRRSQQAIHQSYTNGHSNFTHHIRKQLLNSVSLEQSTHDAVSLVPSNLFGIFEERAHEGLLRLIQDTMILVMTEVVYGLENPFREPSTRKSWV